MNKNGLDEIDKKLLNLLQRNCATGHKALAAALNMSVTPVHVRIKRLERDGYIKRYVALADPVKLDKALVVYTQITLTNHDQESCKDFINKILDFELVQQCHHVSGIFDFLLRVAVTCMEEYSDFLRSLSDLSIIKSIQSVFVLADNKFDTGYYFRERSNKKGW